MEEGDYTETIPKGFLQENENMEKYKHVASVHRAPKAATIPIDPRSGTGFVTKLIGFR